MRLDRPAAVAHLREADHVMRAIVDAVGPLGLRPGARGDHFTTLVRAIVGQQLSGRAAETIWSRVVAGYPDPLALAPADLLAMPDQRLRAAGVSAAKAASIKDLAGKVASGELPVSRMGRLADSEIVSRLVTVRGIGRWTAEMFLIFKLGRPDVWPTTDLGIRNAVRRSYGLVPTLEELEVVAEPWRPYRSAAAWYLWQSLAMETV